MNNSCAIQISDDQTYEFIDSIKYNNNGVKIIASPESMNYIIETDNWYIYWYVSPDDELQIFNRHADRFKCILSFKKKFDMSYFAVLDSSYFNALPSPITNVFKKQNIIYSSSELVDKQVRKLLNLKIFI